LKAAVARDGVSILAFLRHPLTRLGWDASAIAERARALEVLVMRGRHFSAPMRLAVRVRHALAAGGREHRAAGLIPEDVRTDLNELAAVLDDAFAPFHDGEATLGALAGTLAETLFAITREPAGHALIEAEPSGVELIDFLAGVAADGGERRLAARAFGPALDVLLADQVMPPRIAPRRAVILGPLEARLVAADRIILGGLNEGSFPPVAAEDPFLNRAMRLDLGLQPPEWRIGQSAHDFLMLASNPDVALTRASRVEGEPRIASRFLRRIEALVGVDRWKSLVARGEERLALGRLLDAPGPYAPMPAPAPVPAAPRVPERLSITEIEALFRDPYAIYARHILGLEPLEPIDPELDARERGTILHRAIELYAATDPPADPDEAAQRLRDIGAECFRPIAHEAELHAFWWQRFLAIIPEFIAFDRARRDLGNRVLVEQRARLPLGLPGGGTMTITGKADRLEIAPDGTVSAFDYKSGAPPSAGDIAAGLAPQLPITAALIREGAFEAIPANARIGELAHLPIGGAAAVEAVPLALKGMDSEELARRDLARLKETLERLAEGLEGYAPRLKPARANAEGAYDHLARIAEWSSIAAGPGEGEDGDLADIGGDEP
jgi:ATP-dependent helicase/nuclease subunit B